MKTELVPDSLRPCDCQCLSDVLSLNRSSEQCGRFWIIISHDGSVTLAEQYKGKSAETHITIPRHIFQKLLRWYEAEQ